MTVSCRVKLVLPVLLVLECSACGDEAGSRERYFEDRVGTMLEAAAAGDERAALASWTPDWDYEEFQFEYRIFARSAGLKPGMTWSIDSVEVLTTGNEFEPAVAAIGVTIDGRSLALRVEAGQRIRLSPGT